ncbi:DUF222 domain-containing protein [Nocardioides sp. CN2-186]|uniref:HNH endonuclease signature motif containing protein n=1 Tax=Nocardioides tweenelious TaxID=3156607 RepID=UPI0032B37CB5
MTTTADLDSPAGVLDAVRDRTADLIQVEIDRFRLAVEWAVMHPAESVLHAAMVDGTEDELAIAGPGAPLVAEFCVAELALALGMSTDAGKRYLGDAVETRYRLPKLWSRVMRGEVPVWKARQVATRTIGLSEDAAGFVDTHVAPVAHRCSYAQIDRAVDHARDLYDPDEAEARRAEQTEHRNVTVRLGDVTTDGLVYIEATTDLADALAFEAQLSTKAHDLLEHHPHLPLDVRRSMALGHLGDASSRELVIHTHHDTSSTDGLVRVDNTKSWITVEQLGEWCQQEHTRVTIRPVLDLNEHLHTDRYEPTDRLREQVIQTHPTCVFPRCERPSRRCDLDHITEWPEGATDSLNLAPLCRGHHRLKTHGGWTYTRTGHRTFDWTSPHGITYRRT